MNQIIPEEKCHYITYILLGNICQQRKLYVVLNDCFFPTDISFKRKRFLWKVKQQ